MYARLPVVSMGFFQIFRDLFRFFAEQGDTKSNEATSVQLGGKNSIQ